MKTKEKLDLNEHISVFVDMAITIELFCNMYNCNDELLELNGIDWWYLHKINRRAKFILTKTK